MGFDIPVGATATWRNKDHDEPVIITGIRGEHDGIRYYSIEGGATGIPANELIYTNGADKPDFNRMAAEVLHKPEDLLPSRPGVQAPVPSLPPSVIPPSGLAETACFWLDDYIKFSKKWSPRAHDDFHESVGLWLLSTIAARRVAIDLGKRRYTSLYIALTSRTSVFAKSTTAEIAQETLAQVGLSFMLAPDDSTPQAFIRSLTYRLPGDWEGLSTELQDYFKKRVAFAAQKGWFFDEFGQKVNAMMREGGHMADFRGLLRKFDDTPVTYEYDSISRGKDIVYSPYLALLANLTPADLVSHAKRGSALWNDGFWARFAFLTPPLSAVRKNGRFPGEERHIPPELTDPLRLWHRRLGVPEVEVAERDDDNGKVKYDLLVTPPKPHMCIMGKGVYDAYYGYNDALIDLVTQSNLTDLDGNYARLPEKALRVAMLLASLENEERIEMKHWARAQQIAETWRRNLHNLYDQVVGNAEESIAIALEDRIMGQIAEKGPRTMRELVQGIRGLDSTQAKDTVMALLSAGFVQKIRDGKSERYGLIAEQPDQQSVDVDV